MQEYLKSKFRYDTELGRLFWLNGRRTGSIVGRDYKSGRGYRKIGVAGKYYYEHHLIWCWFHGYLPNQIDHINRIRTDNRIENLREASHNQNVYNSKTKKKFKGTSVARINKDGSYQYRAQIRRGKDRWHIGCFPNETDAAKAYDKKAKELFGEFAWLNFPEEI